MPNLISDSKPVESHVLDNDEALGISCGQKLFPIFKILLLSQLVLCVSQQEKHYN